MRRVRKPAEDASLVYQLCISNVSDSALKNRLSAVLPLVAAAAAEYDAAAQAASLHALQPHDTVGGTVTKHELAAVYTERMAKRGSPGRAVYDRLLAAAEHGVCPLCGQRAAATLDHHLPKVGFPSLSVVPSNLVPACRDCNSGKLAGVPSRVDDQTLHPYFDELPDGRWLVGRVIEATPAALHFVVAPPNHWNSVMAARLQHHFRAFRLKELYGVHAAVELRNIQHHLTLLSERGGVVGVREYLEEQADSREACELNSWQSATYRALAGNAWFCSGGFQ